MILDDSTQHKVHYYSFPFNGKGSNRKPLSFYELIYQNGRIALLSRHEYLYSSNNIGTTDGSGVYWLQGNLNTEKIRELIYLTDGESGILEYGSRTKDKNSFLIPEYGYGEQYRDPRAPELYRSTEREEGEKYKIRKKVLQTILGQNYAVVMQYADEQKTRINTLQGLIKLLEFHESMTAD